MTGYWRIAVAAIALTCASGAAAQDIGIGPGYSAEFAIVRPLGQGTLPQNFTLVWDDFSAAGSTYNVSFFYTPVIGHGCTTNCEPREISDVFQQTATGQWAANSISEYLKPYSPVPTQSARLVFGSASAATLIRNVRILEANAAVVPEPASWAMLLVGFAMTGYAMRRRPRAAIA